MNPVLFLIIILLVLGGGAYISYSSNPPEEVPTETPNITNEPTDAPILGICNTGTPIYENGQLIRCECPAGTVGKACQYTRSDYCNGGGNPIADPDTDEFVRCECDTGLGEFCCNETDSLYTRRNRCSDNALCTRNGWKISEKSCDEISDTYKSNPECTGLCSSDTSTDIPSNYANGDGGSIGNGITINWTNDSANNTLKIYTSTNSTNVDNTHLPASYLLVPGIYTYTCIVINDSNDYPIVTLLNTVNNSVVTTISNGVSPWSIATGLTGSFTLIESTRVYANFNNNYYQYRTIVSMNLVNTTAFTSTDNLRCSSYYDETSGLTKGIVSCENSNTSNYSTKSNSNGDPFLQALYYPPNELDSYNKKYWETVKTDRNLTDAGLISSTNQQAKRVQGQYGSFFKVYEFPDDTGSEIDTITNNNLKEAIDLMFIGGTNGRSFSFDNYGNIKIYYYGNKGNLIEKSFNNPAFPKREIEMSQFKNQTDCINANHGWDSNSNKCWKYLQSTDPLSNSPYGTSKDYMLNNKNFITSSNKKWILYNNLSNPLYKLLYNPMHGSNFQKYYNSIPETRNRVDNILIQKYAEMSATKDTYGKNPRQYGDDSAYCFGGAKSGPNDIINFPDCVGYDNDPKKLFINPENLSPDMNTIYTKFKGKCACTGPSCDPDQQFKGKNDSFLKTFQGDMKKYVFDLSKGNGGNCPSNISFTLCSIDTTSANDSNIDRTTIVNNCS